MKDNNESYQDKLNEYIRQLVRVVNRLKKLSASIVIILLLDVFSFTLDALFKFELFYFSFSFYLVLLLSLVGISSLYYFDQTKRRGDILYDVIGDAMEWLRTSKAKYENLISDKEDDYEKARDSIEKIQSKMMQVQYTLRSFARASDLPIIEGQNGRAAYLMIFTSLIVVVTVFRLITL